jgi:hypothetical protein
MDSPGQPGPHSPLEGEILPLNPLLILRKIKPFLVHTLNRFGETRDLTYVAIYSLIQ